MKPFLLFVTLLITVSVNGQGDNEFDNSLEKQFSVGWSNPISFISNINEINTISKAIFMGNKKFIGWISSTDNP